MTPPRALAIVQTAFIGDVVLTLPLAQAVARAWPSTRVLFVAIPATAGLLENHPAVAATVVFDKKKGDAGPAGLLRAASRLRAEGTEVVLVPHRSLRSAVLARLSGAALRVGFSTSAGRILLNRIVPYRKELHEIDRDLSLLGPLGIEVARGESPSLHPDADDRRTVDGLLAGHDGARMIAVAPGSVWNTKRWPEEKFAALVRMLAAEGRLPVLVGGEADRALAARVAGAAGQGSVVNAAGRLSLLQSAELIRRCSAAVSNDSAPMHLAVAMGTPVVALYGATVPEFGFAPRGPHDRVLQTLGLPCRPCAIHGGNRCPIRTFVCMERIAPAEVLAAVLHAAEAKR